MLQLYESTVRSSDQSLQIKNMIAQIFRKRNESTKYQNGHQPNFNKLKIYQTDKEIEIFITEVIAIYRRQTLGSQHLSTTRSRKRMKNRERKHKMKQRNIYFSSLKEIFYSTWPTVGETAICLSIILPFFSY